MQAKNDKLLNNVNYGLLNLRNAINKNEILENENPKRKGKGRPSDLAKHIKILTPKRMLRRLPIALEQVKAGNTSENLLNKIRKIIYSFYRAK